MFACFASCHASLASPCREGGGRGNRHFWYVPRGVRILSHTSGYCPRWVGGWGVAVSCDPYIVAMPVLLFAKIIDPGRRCCFTAKKKKDNAKNVPFQLHALRKKEIRKQITKVLFCPPPPPFLSRSHLCCMVHPFSWLPPLLLFEKVVGPCCKLHWCFGISCALPWTNSQLAFCLLVHVYGMDCNPRVQRIHICVPV